jgi:osmotically-inducible protein OsmY
MRLISMTHLKAKFIRAMLVCGLATASLFAPDAQAQQTAGTVAKAPVVTTDRSLTVEHDKVRTSAEHIYNSSAERANDDLLITEVKSSLAERGISDKYPVEVDCDHGTIQLSGVVASADDARDAAAIALNTRGVVGVKNRLTWR